MWHCKLTRYRFTHQCSNSDSHQVTGSKRCLYIRSLVAAILILNFDFSSYSASAPYICMQWGLARVIQHHRCAFMGLNCSLTPLQTKSRMNLPGLNYLGQHCTQEHNKNNKTTVLSIIGRQVVLLNVQFNCFKTERHKQLQSEQVCKANQDTNQQAS